MYWVTVAGNIYVVFHGCRKISPNGPNVISFHFSLRLDLEPYISINSRLEARAIVNWSAETDSARLISDNSQKKKDIKPTSVSSKINRSPSMSPPLESVVSNVSFVLEQNARLITTVGTLSAISFAVVPRVEQNYREYIDAGRGGLPPNVIGWAKSTFLKLFHSYETTNTDMYLSDPNKDTWLDPSEITQRSGERPIFNWHPVPCRQLTQRADPAMHEVRPIHIGSSMFQS